MRRTAIVLEGEKAADAAQRLFPDYVAMSWMGGTGGVDAADYSPLKARNVVVWPDADAPGAKAAATLLEMLPRGAPIIHTASLRDGFDAADLEHDGVDDPEAWLNERLRGTPEPQPPPKPGTLDPNLAVMLLSVRSLLERDIPPPERLLGSLITRSTRMFLVGGTGTGKTMIGYSIAAGMASAGGFLHWRSERACRVLVFDGEMPGELVQARLRDALRRAGLEEAPEGLFCYSLDLVEQLGKAYPAIGRFASLWTEEGQRFVMRLVEALTPDAIIFDNVMSLLGTAALEPEKWEATLPLVAALTANRIGQLWLDHTNRTGGHYGTVVKEWCFDTVGLMRPVDPAGRRGDDIAFKLTFEKARRRTPDNRADYDDVIIRLRDDRWASEPADRSTARQPLKPSRKKFYDALLDALTVASTAPGETTKAAWLSECIRKGHVQPPDPNESSGTRRIRLAPFYRAQSDLVAGAWVGIDGERVIDRAAGPPRP